MMMEDITPQDISPKDILEDFVIKYHIEDYNTNKKKYISALVKENTYKEK